MLKLYNTLTRQVEPIKPSRGKTVTVYTCGPTVYLEPHIGNWRTFIFYDLLVKTLTVLGYQPQRVMNITDVGHLTSDADEGEDKLAAEAAVERKSAWQVAEQYTDLFIKGMKRLDLQLPKLVKATDHIDEQIELIKTLEDKGFTYTISDGVYFDTAKLPDYGRLAGIKRDQQLAGARVEAHPGKRHHTDFALWKFSPPGSQRDMEWPSPWGKGFPGWHLECSAMAIKYLGNTLDIHAGGVDHIGVHHPNEIAQSEAATGQPFAKHWMHTEFMLVDGQKMSKSLGNTFILDDIAAKADPMAFKLLVLMSHYRSQQNFTWEALEAAQHALNSIYAWADLVHQAKGQKATWLKDFEKALANDLGTPEALAVLMPHLDQAPSRATLKLVDSVFGLRLLDRPDISTEQKQLISNRQKARQQNDYDLSDRLRDQLQSQGLELKDTPSGPRWRRLTT